MMAVKSAIRAEEKLAVLEATNRGMAGGDSYKNMHADLMQEING
jgi:hypothetical protein